MRKPFVFAVALWCAAALGFAPKEGDCVSQLRPEFGKYRAAAVAPVDTDLDWNAIAGKGDFSTGKPVKFEFDAPAATLELSAKPDMTGAKTYDVQGGTSVEVVNLLVNTKYWWRTVDADGKKSGIHSFRTADEAPRWITAPGLSNVRDIGNRKSERYGGRTRQGLLFRGSEFDDHMNISDEGRRVIVDELGIRTDLDFRATRFKKSDKYTPVFDGTLNHVLIPLTDYAKIFDNKDTQERYRRIFSLLADRSNYPVHAHCWGGAAR
ncbi:MAG: tyrosine-protein phosphatase, partial [Victivallaceae bacterium]|nr:tyrosine-protein phosphatase [Victivallaceae bacterium]